VAGVLDADRSATAQRCRGSGRYVRKAAATRAGTCSPRSPRCRSRSCRSARAGPAPGA